MYYIYTLIIKKRLIIRKLLMNINEDILLHYFNNSLSPQETEAVEQWYTASEENKQKLQDFYALYKLSEATKAYEQTDSTAKYKEIEHLIRVEKPKKKLAHPMLFSIRKYAAVAAAFFIGVCFTILGIFVSLDTTHSSYIALTNKDQRSEIILPDGSRVWLNASTQIAFDQSLWSKDRRLNLSGEAYFEIKHNKNKPFIVSADGVDVKVLGTKFNVRTRKEEQEVITTLLDGSVEVYSNQKAESKILKPGQSAVVKTTDGSTHLFNYKNPEDILLWRDGELIFEDQSLLAITQTLEQLYNCHFLFKNEKLKEEIFTCEFSTDNSIDFILNILTLTEKFQYQIDGNIITLF